MHKFAFRFGKGCLGGGLFLFFTLVFKYELPFLLPAA
ncbi:Putative protein [Zobellia galactanivorans]|uniref:Uncharacterized protein n=1 Tax=Zobellia galactanivorans (strain DSM 12802 / CCUG 47099 / CIP 106680 / NCIMB 13871 / Dsij) TaxID=63186 RepID=G0L6S5_ZOBGA|nr:Putative protein [Zobellia galactanivorans]